MSERGRNIIVGLTTIGAIVGLVSMLLLFGYVPEFLERGYTVYVRMENAGGVLPGNRILYQGLDVGQVTEVRRRNGLAAGIEVTTRINEDQRIPVGSTVRVSRPALGGSPTVEFVPPAQPTEEALATDGSAMVNGKVTSAFAELGDSLKSTVNGLVGQLNGKDGALAKFNKLADEWTQVGENINQLTRQMDLGEIDSGQAQGNLASVLARADTAVRKIDTALNGVNAYLYDEELKKNITQTAANARELTRNLSQWSTKVDGFTDDIGASVKELKQAYVNVADQLSVFIDSATKLADAARNGDGAMGKFINDPALYNNLNDAAARLSKAIDDVRLLVEKWKAEGLPVQF